MPHVWHTEDMAKSTAYQVIEGSYDDEIVLAVFVDRDDAEAFTNHQTRTRAYSHTDDLPRVEEIDFYAKGAWRPGEEDFIDGELVSLELENSD